MLDPSSTLALVGGLGLGAIVIAAARRPDTFCIVRSVTIAAPPQTIFPLIDDLHRFNAWNPFITQDPTVSLSYSGPARGQGAAHTWVGNRKVGQGTLEIMRSQPSTRIDMALHMVKPMAADNRVVFTLEPRDGATLVTWSMEGAQPFAAKLMGLVFNVDGMVGAQFKGGLASLKALAEG
jgi:Polyketide cyclase / dehydrase and lipid transport